MALISGPTGNSRADAVPSDDASRSEAFWWTDPAGTQRNDSLMELPNPLADTLGDLRRSLTDLVQGVVRTNLRTSQEMLRVTTHNEFLALQQRFIRDYMGALMHGSVQLMSAMQHAGVKPPQL